MSRPILLRLALAGLLVSACTGDGQAVPNASAPETAPEAAPGTASEPTSEASSEPNAETVTAAAGATRGPLRHTAGEWFFRDRDGRPVVLVGSHTWDNLQDWGDRRPDFDYPAYLDLLAAHGHTFIRMWTWDSPSPGADGPFAPAFRPLPWRRRPPSRTGRMPFDLEPGAVDPAFLSRLRLRVELARKRGIYVSVMLFQGWTVQRKCRACPDPWPHHPFAAGNNNRGLAGDVDGDGDGQELHRAAVPPAIAAVQRAYVGAVVRAVCDLDNVLFEVANESDAGSTWWQYAVIAEIAEVERAHCSARHPIGMTSQGAGVSDAPLWRSEADWISPGGARYATSPPPADGRKVVIADTDHLPPVLMAGAAAHRRWIWKSLTRGLFPIVMDPVQNPFSHRFAKETDTELAKWPEIRAQLGRARAWAERIDLTAAKPTAGETYCLAAAGEAYLCYSPDGGAIVIDDLPAGSYAGEWLDPASGRTEPIEITGAGTGRKARFVPPRDGGDAVLLLRAGGEGVGVGDRR